MTRPAAPDVDTQPSDHPLADEDRLESWGDSAERGRDAMRGKGVDTETDEQLKRDKPPHWG